MWNTFPAKPDWIILSSNWNSSGRGFSHVVVNDLVLRCFIVCTGCVLYCLYFLVVFLMYILNVEFVFCFAVVCGVGLCYILVPCTNKH